MTIYRNYDEWKLASPDDEQRGDPGPSESADDAIGAINQTFKELKVTLTNAILDAETPILGVAANFKENSPVGVRIDDIQWRFAEARTELFGALDDLCGDIVGRIQNADDIQQVWGE